MPVVIRNPHTHSASLPLSYYAATQHFPSHYPKLDDKIRTDICVIGGGFSGINTAIELAERGFSVVVLEAFKVGWGATGRNGGQLIRGITHEVERFTNEIGEDGVKAVAQMGLEAVNIVTERIRLNDIQCDLTMGFADLAHKPRDIKALEEEKHWLDSVNYPHETALFDQSDVSDYVGSANYLGGLVDRGSGHLHPLNLVLGEARVARNKGVRIFENSCVESIQYGEPNKVNTAYGSVVADKIVMCANAYVEGLDKTLQSQVLPCGSYIVTTGPLPQDVCDRISPQKLALCDMRIALDYYRITADNRLLFGGSCNYSGRDPKNIEAAMRPKMEKVFPFLKGVKIDFQWGGMIGIGANRMPQIGRLSPNVYYAQAYCGHGLNTTHLAARILAEAINAESQRIEIFEKVKHLKFPGGPMLRSPLLAIGMSWHQLRDLF